VVHMRRKAGAGGGERGREVGERGEPRSAVSLGRPAALGGNFAIGTGSGTESGTVVVHGASMDRSTALPKLTFSTREVAAMLGVSRPTVDRMVASGILPSVDLGPTRRTLIPAWAIEELLAGPDRLTA
jgi:excisionase family DNA binding protein